jgi:hypothetical protein
LSADAINVKCQQDNKGKYASATGTDTIVLTLIPAITAYVSGQEFFFKAGGTNTGATTINVNAVGAVAVIDHDGNALVGGELEAGKFYSILYDGTSFRLPKGSDTPITTEGDMVVGDASGEAVRLPIGTAGQVPTVDASGKTLEYQDAGGGAWNIKHSGTFSSVSSKEITTDMSAETIIKLRKVTVSADSAYLEGVISIDGGSSWENTSGDYAYIQVGSKSNSSTPQTNFADSVAQLNLTVNGQSNDTAHSADVDVHIPSPEDTTNHKNMYLDSITVDYDNASIRGYGGGRYKGTDAVDGFRLDVNTGTMSGSYEVWEKN